jgi:YebC/PmpR family DNA-binding regulatory protein
MAGHSHSANIKFRKDRVDAKRARAFSKMARMITVAAKAGGGDPDANPRLRLAIEKARVVNMTKDGIERAIRKGTGEGETGAYEEALYEGYAPGGVAVIVEALTDNRNRTSPELRKIFERAGGHLAGAGTVAYLFHRKAVFVVDPHHEVGEEKLLEVVLDAGAEDLVTADGTFEIHGAPGDFVAIKEALERAQVPLAVASVTQVPGNSIDLPDVDDARRVLRLIDMLEEHDDVQTVSTNHRLSDAVAARLAEES